MMMKLKPRPKPSCHVVNRNEKDKEQRQRQSVKEAVKWIASTNTRDGLMSSLFGQADIYKMY